MKFYRRVAVLAAICLFLFQSLALAAGAKLLELKFHSGSQHDRIVFYLDKVPSYQVKSSADGKELVIDLSDATKEGARRLAASGKRVDGIRFEEKDGHLYAHVKLKSAWKYQVGKLSNPPRLYLDVLSEPAVLPHDSGQKDGKTDKKPQVLPKTNPLITETELAKGLTQKNYVYFDPNGQVSAYFVFADKSKYRMEPVLDNGIVPGRNAVTDIARSYGADAAVNASYFARSGEILGVLKMDGETAGTTYIPRSAIGIREDGSVFFGQVSYSGYIQAGKVSLPVAGVDAERGENGLVVYNHWNGRTTGTNEYGIEYVVQDGRVTKIQQGNSVIPEKGFVISAHGTAKDALSGLRVGDTVTFTEQLGEPWDSAIHILGAGPRLVEKGKINVTTNEEKFGSDVSYGRAPRTAVGVTKDGDYVLAVVDGRQSHSRGCTLREWAVLLKNMGIVDAINLDGGGSAELVAKGEILNSPSDGEERPVASALLFLKK